MIPAGSAGTAHFALDSRLGRPSVLQSFEPGMELVNPKWVLTPKQVELVALGIEARANSENPCLPKGVKSQACWVGTHVADYHMVEQFDVEGPGRFPELAGLCEATDYGNWTTARLARRA